MVLYKELEQLFPQGHTVIKQQDINIFLDILDKINDINQIDEDTFKYAPQIFDALFLMNTKQLEFSSLYEIFQQTALSNTELIEYIFETPLRALKRV